MRFLEELVNAEKYWAKMANQTSEADSKVKKPSKLANAALGLGLGVVSALGYAGNAEAKTPGQKTTVADVRSFAERHESTKSYALAHVQDAQDDRSLYGRSGLNLAQEEKGVQESVRKNPLLPAHAHYFCQRGNRRQHSGIIDREVKGKKQYRKIGNRPMEIQVTDGETIGRTVMEWLRGNTTGESAEYNKLMSPLQRARAFKAFLDNAPKYGLDPMQKGVPSFYVQCELLDAMHTNATNPQAYDKNHYVDRKTMEADLKGRRKATPAPRPHPRQAPPKVAVKHGQPGKQGTPGIGCTWGDYSAVNNGCYREQRCANGTEKVPVAPERCGLESKATPTVTPQPRAHPKRNAGPAVVTLSKTEPSMWEHFSAQGVFAWAENARIYGGTASMIIGSPVVPGQERRWKLSADGYLLGGHNLLTQLVQGFPVIAVPEGQNITQYGLRFEYDARRWGLHGSAGGISSSRKYNTVTGPTRTGDDANWEELTTSREDNEKSHLAVFTLGAFGKRTLDAKRALRFKGTLMAGFSKGRAKANETNVMDYASSEVITEQVSPDIVLTQDETGRSETNLSQSTNALTKLFAANLEMIYERPLGPGQFYVGGLVHLSGRYGNLHNKTTLEEMISWETTNTRTVDGVQQSQSTTLGSRDNSSTQESDQHVKAQYNIVPMLVLGYDVKGFNGNLRIGYDFGNLINDDRSKIPVVASALALFNGNKWAAGVSGYLKGGLLNAEAIAAYTNVAPRLADVLAMQNELMTTELMQENLAYQVNMHNWQRLPRLQRGQFILYGMGGAEHNFSGETRILAAIGGGYHRLGGRATLAVGRDSHRVQIGGDLGVRVYGPLTLFVRGAYEKTPSGQDAKIFGLGVSIDK